jgi:hypothetical protein
MRKAGHDPLWPALSLYGTGIGADIRYQRHHFAP